MMENNIKFGQGRLVTNTSEKMLTQVALHSNLFLSSVLFHIPNTPL